MSESVRTRPSRVLPQGSEAAVAEGARERILAAAVERIATDGIDDVRIARIAMDAGVSTSLVHYHFETREALLEQALEYSFELAGDVRIGEEEGDAPDHTRRLAAMVDQCLPYPGELERDWILWVELWLRAVRHAELRPTAAGLYERMRRWFAEAIAAGVQAGEFDANVDPDRTADRVLALCDGFGVRALLGDLEIDRARAGVWAVLSRDLGVDPAPR
jgi:AcrR family transcriptional regulator